MIELLANDLHCVPSSGMGRLFDAVSALLGICMTRTYEGQPAIMLEAVAAQGDHGSYAPRITADKSGMAVFDGAQTLLDPLHDCRNGVAVPIIAARFHATIALATATIAERIAREHGTELVCLSGGCFQNALLLERTLGFLKDRGLTPAVHRLVPPNDEAVSYGQTVIAGMRRAEQ